MLYIDDLAVDNYRLGKTDPNGYTEVFVNNNASCHKLPSHWLSGILYRSKYVTTTIKTGGHTYRMGVIKI